MDNGILEKGGGKSRKLVRETKAGKKKDKIKARSGNCSKTKQKTKQKLSDTFKMVAEIFVTFMSLFK